MELHAAIGFFLFLAIIRIERAILSIPDPGQPLWLNPLTDQVLHHCLRTASGKIDVVIRWAIRICVSLNLHADGGEGNKRPCRLVQQRK